MYGFNPPIHEALGYGKGLHDALAEMHKRAIDRDVPDVSEAVELVDRHLSTPYAYPALRSQLRRSAIDAIERYFAVHGDDLTRTVHAEKQIRVQVAPGVTVDGRIDLIRRLETDEVAIVDFKSTARAQPEDVTRDQLHVYALGYRELTSESADLIEVLILDERGRTTREQVVDPILEGVREKIEAVADDIRANRYACTHDHTGDRANDDLAWLCAPVRR
ncbi:RecB family exonuclease [Agromyces larvae]|uniref:PD-(D/E)XK nuclease family protein n=1 Tax=Agromyces larvae TaxID=2929802 RepID=A0ABY4C253_9MICO|nr:PD-(D/E)XK nuclease family protein [Agromyces larvae]UOE45560.1 PD-(D/E)XK nuclease family protein [Agromyces larvae]